MTTADEAGHIAYGAAYRAASQAFKDGFKAANQCMNCTVCPAEKYTQLDMLRLAHTAGSIAAHAARDEIRFAEDAAFMVSIDDRYRSSDPTRRK